MVSAGRLFGLSICLNRLLIVVRGYGGRQLHLDHRRHPRRPRRRPGRRRHVAAASKRLRPRPSATVRWSFGVFESGQVIGRRRVKKATSARAVALP